MKTITSWTAVELLKLTGPEQLYTGDSGLAKNEYRALAKRWHPDHEGGNTEVFAHIKALFEQAEEKLKAGLWVTPGKMMITSIDGKTYELSFKKHHTIEIGDMYIGSRVIIYAVDKANDDLFKNGLARIKSFKYPDGEVQKHLAGLLPKVRATVETVDKHFMVIEKPEGVVLLKDLLAHYGGALDPKHVAWIVSRLYNLGCYLRWAGLAHNDLALETIFIEPTAHAAYLLGGWWFTSELGKKLMAVPGSLVKHAPSSLLTEKVGSASFDLELIKLLGRQLLGSESGNKLRLDKTLPRPMVNWLRTPTSGDSYAEFSTWKNKVLVDSFGARKFHKMDVTETSVYA